jgi:integrase
MGSIYRRGQREGKPRGPYYIGWMDSRGHQHTESTRVKGQPGTGYSYAAAKRLLADREAAVGKGAPITGQTGKRLFTECLEDVVHDQTVNGRRDVEGTRRRITLHLAPFFDRLRIGEVTTAEIRRYTAERKDTGAEAATINRELAIVRRAVRLALRAGDLLTAPHVELLDESRNVRRGIIEPTEFARVLKRLTPASYAAVAEAALITGWRLRSELLTLTWGQADLRAAQIRMDPGMSKAGEGRTFPITTRLRKLLAAQRRGRGQPPQDGLVFTETDGRAIHPKRFYKAWGVATSAANVPNLTPHDLRRSAVREMERRRIPRQVAMKLIGHRTEHIYRRYAIVTEGDLLEAGAALDRPAVTAFSLHSKRTPTKGQRRKRQIA